MYNFDTIAPDIEANLRNIALHYYRNTRHYVSIELDDLLQVARIAVWQSLQRQQEGYAREQVVAYCLARARGAILDTIAEARRQSAYSLDEMQSPRSDGSRGRQFADSEPAATGAQVTSSVKRQVVLRMLRKNLSTGQIAALLATYRIDNPQTGMAETREQVMKRLGINANAFALRRLRGLRKLQRVGNVGGRV